MPITRETMTFWLPSTLADVLTPPGLENTSDRVSRKLYLNPQTVNIREQKLINEQLTKGGFVIQYWGEQLQELQASGTTGSSGIEGINILRDIYRHEQAAMRAVLLERQDLLAVNARESAIAKGLADDEEYSTFEGILDLTTGGAYSSITSGVSNAIDILTDAASGSYLDLEHSQFSAPPNLASFATTIDIHFQGEMFRGFFTTFSYTEDANTPGIFTYQFTFKITKRVGLRNNFMPWHRSPVSYDGETVQASTPPNSTMLSELTFPYTNETQVELTAVPSDLGVNDFGQGVTEDMATDDTAIDHDISVNPDTESQVTYDFGLRVPGLD